MNDLRYPIGQFAHEGAITASDIEGWIDDIGALPRELRAAVEGLDALHGRLVVLLRSLTREQLLRQYVHPESGPNRLDRKVGDYAWHGKHHVAHITSLRDREGW